MTDIDLSPTTWRLLLTPPAIGAWNMAVDEAVLESVWVGESLPTLRLYAWSPPCLSLGYAQSYADVDHLRLEARGWGLVRRLTGGRAILHTDELTYAVIAPHGEPRLSGNILESYRRLSHALVAAMVSLDVPAEADPKSKGDNGSPKNPAPVCFEVPSNYEITVRGKKLIGSAQARKKSGILQHGTLPLHGDLTRIIQVMEFPDETSREFARLRLLDRATTVESEIGNPISWDKASKAFIRAFERALRITFVESNLSASEETRATQLINQKYANPDWIKRI